MTGKIKLLIADDHAIVRYGLNSLFSAQNDMTVVGQAKNGEEAVKLTLSEHPDVVIMDLVMPKMDGAEATAEIKARCPETKILLLTSFGSYEGVRHAIESGAEGAIQKTAEDETLIPTIRRIFRGEKIVSPDIKRQMDDNPPIAHLTSLQIEILEGVTRGLSNAEIAKMLGTSMPNIRDRLNVVFQKIGAANRAEAVAIAMRKNLLHHAPIA